MTRRTCCGGCGSGDLNVFLDLGTSPLADAFPIEPGLEDRYPLQVAYCPQCWLVQLMDIVPDHLLYGSDYGFYSSSSPSLVDYDRQFAQWVSDRFDVAGHTVVEVACNDGSLLRHFAGVTRAIGVEPASGPAEVARGRGLDVVGEAFGVDVARRLLWPGSRRRRLVIAKNVAAHVADLNDFMAGIAHLIRDDGSAVIEVQYFADLLAGNQFDHVYHEHRYFFSLRSLGDLLARHGMSIASAERVPAQGGSIRVVATSGRSPGDWHAEDWLRRPETYAGVQGRAEHLRTVLRDLLHAEAAAGRKVAGYAASAKSATLLNWCGIGPDLLDHVVDTTPHKIGRFTPGTHIPIVGPGDRPVPDTYLLLAWNYLSGVMRRERAFIDAGGRFIVPIPQPVIL